MRKLPLQQLPEVPSSSWWPAAHGAPLTRPCSLPAVLCQPALLVSVLLWFLRLHHDWLLADDILQSLLYLLASSRLWSPWQRHLCRNTPGIAWAIQEWPELWGKGIGQPREGDFSFVLISTLPAGGIRERAICWGQEPAFWPLFHHFLWVTPLFPDLFPICCWGCWARLVGIFNYFLIISH